MHILVCISSNVGQFSQLMLYYSILLMAPMFLFGRALMDTTGSPNSTILLCSLSRGPCSRLALSQPGHNGSRSRRGGKDRGRKGVRWCPQVAC